MGFFRKKMKKYEGNNSQQEGKIIQLKRGSCKVKSVTSGCPIWCSTSEQDEVFFVDSSHKPGKKRDIDQVKALFVIENFLSGKECDKLIEDTEKLEYTKALVSVGYNKMIEMSDYRTNQRVIYESTPSYTNTIYERLKPYMPPKILNDNFEISGLNERLRFYRYQSGDFFGPHYDGCFPRGNECSQYTFLIYLNDVAEENGGCTTFYHSNHKIAYELYPKKGMAVIFPHGSNLNSPYHDGAMLNKGLKYVFRSDVMYLKK